MVVCVGSVIDWTMLTRGGGFYFEGFYILILSSRSCAVCLYFVPSETAVYFNPYSKLPVHNIKNPWQIFQCLMHNMVLSVNKRS